MRCGVSPTLAACRWYGRGPEENYEDRRAGAWTGIHAGRVMDLFHRYTDPQEAGLRTGVRWLELTTPRGPGGLAVEATGDNLLECSVVPTTLISLEAGRNAIDLVEPKQHILRIDHRNTGLGGTDSWGQQPLPRYLIQPRGEYTWSFILTPIPPGGPRQPPGDESGP